MLTTTAKGNLVAALNELKADVDAAASSGGASINDVSTSTASVWSSTRTSEAISEAVTALVNGAPGLLDTLEELATALGKAKSPAFASRWLEETRALVVG